MRKVYAQQTLRQTALKEWVIWADERPKVVYLLNTLSANIANGMEDPRATWDFVHLVEEDNTLLGSLNVEVGILQEFGDHRFNVLADITGLREGGAITDGKWDV